MTLGYRVTTHGWFEHGNTLSRAQKIRRRVKKGSIFRACGLAWVKGIVFGVVAWSWIKRLPPDGHKVDLMPATHNLLVPNCGLLIRCFPEEALLHSL
jgi:hypothetical protein